MLSVSVGVENALKTLTRYSCPIRVRMLLVYWNTNMTNKRLLIMFRTSNVFKQMCQNHNCRQYARLRAVQVNLQLAHLDLVNSVISLVWVLLSCQTCFICEIWLTFVAEFAPGSDSNIDARPLPLITSRKLLFPHPVRPAKQAWLETLSTPADDKLGIVDLHPDVFATFPRLAVSCVSFVIRKMYDRD